MTFLQQCDIFATHEKFEFFWILALTEKPRSSKNFSARQKPRSSKNFSVQKIPVALQIFPLHKKLTHSPTRQLDLIPPRESYRKATILLLKPP